MTLRVAISTAADPQGSSRVDILTLPDTTAACAAGVLTVTAGGDSSHCRLPRELKDTPASAGLRIQLS